jgi:hypothetical protein
VRRTFTLGLRGRVTRGYYVDSGPNLEERAIVPAGIINMHILYIIQCGSGTDFSNKTVARPCGTRDNKQTNIGTPIWDPDLGPRFGTLILSPNLGGDMGPPFGTPIWDPHLGPPFGTPIWDPHSGPPFGTPIWDPHLGPLFGTPIWDPYLGPLFWTLILDPDLGP